MRRLVLCGVGLLLCSLVGGVTPPIAWAAGADAPMYREYRGYPAYHDCRGYRLHRGPEGDAPDQVTIHKGRKCQIRCERIQGAHGYRCRDSRC